MPVTVIVEPDPGGHRFQYVSHVAAQAARTGEVVLLTSRGAADLDEFGTYLADAPLRVEECFDEIYPPTHVIARTVAEFCARLDVETVFVMDADQSLKRWWRVAPPALRGLPRRPRVIFLLTRYPARLSLLDRLGWLHRISKSTLALLAMARGSLSRIVTLAGRDDLNPGWLVKRLRDPAICSAHSWDRVAIRQRLDLPHDRHLVGIFGVVSDRKNVPMVAAAVLASGTDADLLLAGTLEPDVAAWLAEQPESTRQRVIVREGFLSNEQLDQLVAAADVVTIAQNNNGPSGIMGKAVAAGVPVLSAGSKVRARESVALDAGVNTELTVAGLAAGLREIRQGQRSGSRAATAELPTAESFAAVMFGTTDTRGGALAGRRPSPS
jgi:hypothetical protein